MNEVSAMPIFAHKHSSCHSCILCFLAFNWTDFMVFTSFSFGKYATLERQPLSSSIYYFFHFLSFIHFTILPIYFIG